LASGVLKDMSNQSGLTFWATPYFGLKLLYRKFIARLVVWLHQESNTECPYEVYINAPASLNKAGLH